MVCEQLRAGQLREGGSRAEYLTTYAAQREGVTAFAGRKRAGRAGLVERQSFLSGGCEPLRYDTWFEAADEAGRNLPGASGGDGFRYAGHLRRICKRRRHGEGALCLRRYRG